MSVPGIVPNKPFRLKARFDSSAALAFCLASRKAQPRPARHFNVPVSSALASQFLKRTS